MYEIVKNDYDNREIIEIVNIGGKKNIVCKITFSNNESAVLKLYQEGNKENEIKILKICRKLEIDAPKILQIGNDYLILEYIKGENMGDLISESISEAQLKILAEWLYNFHKLMKTHMGKNWIKGDSRVANFILQNNKIYGIDFEESRKGIWQRDIAEITTSILDMNPMFTQWKIQLSRKFIKYYLELRNDTNEEDIEILRRTIIEVLRDTSIRRGNIDAINKFIMKLKLQEINLI